MLPNNRIDYDPLTMIGFTARDKKIIERALESGRELKVDITELGLKVVDREFRIALAQYISYDPDTMIGKTDKDDNAIMSALEAGRKLHVVRVNNELRVIDVICYIGTAIFKK